MEADLVLERIDGEKSVQSVELSTATGGTLRVSSTGQLPSVKLSQLRQVRAGLRQVAEVSGQNVLFEHNGKQLARLQLEGATPRWSIRWWAMIRQWLFRAS